MTSDELDADAKIAALEDLREELQEKPVKDTRLAGLYEEVSTAPPQLWNRATAFIDCEDASDGNDLDQASGEPTGDGTENGEPDVRARAVVTDVSKLARGWWAPEIVEDCDAMVTVDVHAGMPLEAFVARATEELEESIESIRADEADDGGSPL